MIGKDLLWSLLPCMVMTLIVEGSFSAELEGRKEGRARAFLSILGCQEQGQRQSIKAPAPGAGVKIGAAQEGQGIYEEAGYIYAE